MQSGVIRVCGLLTGLVLPVCGQSETDMKAVLERLDRLERQNRELMQEVRALRSELAAARPPEQPSPAPEATPVPERVTVAERRIDVGAILQQRCDCFAVATAGRVGNRCVDGGPEGRRQHESS